MKKWSKKIIRFSGRLVLISFVTLCLFECSYRYQWVDFYSAEWNGLNKEIKGECDILVFGDSFSAQNDSYIEFLRQQGKVVMNAAVPGTCALQSSYFFSDRVKQTKPKLVLFQVYLGNDLIDLNPPINYSELGLMRNIYWGLSKRFHSIQYVNYKLGQTTDHLDADQLETNQSKAKIEFAPENYSARTKLYLKSDPEIYNKMLWSQDEYTDDIIRLLRIYKEMIAELPTGTKYKFLLIPHFAQLNENLNNRLILLGGKTIDKIDQTDLITQAFENLFGEENVLNPIDCFRQEEASIYYENDPHLTAYGHQVLGKYLIKNL